MAKKKQEEKVQAPLPDYVMINKVEFHRETVFAMKKEEFEELYKDHQHVDVKDTWRQIQELKK